MHPKQKNPRWCLQAWTSWWALKQTTYGSLALETQKENRTSLEVSVQKMQKVGFVWAPCCSHYPKQTQCQWDWHSTLLPTLNITSSSSQRMFFQACRAGRMPLKYHKVAARKAGRVPGGCFWAWRGSKSNPRLFMRLHISCFSCITTVRLEAKAKGDFLIVTFCSQGCIRVGFTRCEQRLSRIQSSTRHLKILRMHLTQSIGSSLSSDLSIQVPERFRVSKDKSQELFLCKKGPLNAQTIIQTGQGS